ncbi:MAG TPA: hypothetical protein IAD24_04360 [Candidatus Aphodomorpha intestinavium]|uniref:Uncharacterized protein n=1 Tax=Candidatus Aphodomorpha intestinavium TaxID=2840672 RepID=A0A9D1N429_9FIRM|nr:hypothetical protein [Candidatus Aphodomorpha intestinavium]
MPPSVGAFLLFLFIFSFSFLSGERKENQKRKPGTRLGWPAAPARQRNALSPQKIFCGAFLRSFSFCERKRTKKKAQEPAWVGPLLSPVSGTHVPRKKYFAGLFFQKSPAGKNRKRMPGAARPMGHAHPPPR